MPLYTQEQFDQLTCNRCGACCEKFYISLPNNGRVPVSPLERKEKYWNYEGPLGWLEWTCYWETQIRAGNAPDMPMPNVAMCAPQDPWLWYGQLTPSWDTESEVWKYSCGHFSRDEDGQGVCGIHDANPAICADFPYGRAVNFEAWPDCSFKGTIEFDVVMSAEAGNGAEDSDGK